ncbi:sensor histidine kinase [Alicyclobacillus contaminans]|uniref:sensor histidine kinase n=1 Tax=Alicyclobacillus contaminans TaxID=392016 RepID=UPI0003FB8210|nr:HAMP domain-containing sensor histidine kinase [Alicyclobacillus contaminans]
MWRWLVRDNVRWIAAWVASHLLFAVVVVLGCREMGQRLPWTLVGYACLLSAFVLVVVCAAEWLVRRPFLRALEERMRREVQLFDGDLVLPAATWEQQRMAALLSEWYRSAARSQAEQEERQQFFRDFIQRFVHQMKTPLTSLRLLEQSLRAVLNPTHAADASRWADQLADDVERLEQSVDAMLHTARLRAFEFDAHMEQLDVVAVLRQVIRAHKNNWIRRRIYPKLVSDQPVVHASTDGKWFAFLAEQIMRNALQYGYRLDEAGERQAATFVVEVRVGQEGVCVAFTDEGIGIPPQDLPRVFQPFYTGANGRTHSRATGMGLYLVRMVADKLGHTVQIQSALGQGTTVTLLLKHADYHRPARLHQGM